MIEAVIKQLDIYAVATIAGNDIPIQRHAANRVGGTAADEDAIAQIRQGVGAINGHPNQVALNHIASAATDDNNAMFVSRNNIAGIGRAADLTGDGIGEI